MSAIGHGFGQADWWDEEKLRAYCAAYCCGFCGNIGADFRYDPSVLDLSPVGSWLLHCRSCGARVGLLPWPDGEWLKQVLGPVLDRLDYGEPAA